MQRGRGVGGSWTFYDAHLSSGARFGFGIGDMGSDDAGISFAPFLWTVPSSGDGAKIVSAVAEKFGGKNLAVQTPQPLHFMPIHAAILGRATDRGATGGFGGNGTWTATKLFLQRRRLEAEVFFNFDPVGKDGELSEKDPDYADDMVAFLAGELRDGPPARTPATDPRISASGPKLGAWQPYAPAGAMVFGFEEHGKRLVFSSADGTGSKVVSASLENISDQKLVARVDHDVQELRCAQPANDPCLVTEGDSHNTKIDSDHDTKVYHLVQRAKQATRTLDASWNGPALGLAFSPDGAFVVFDSLDHGIFSLHFVAVDGSTSATTKLGTAPVGVRSPTNIPRTTRVCVVSPIERIQLDATERALIRARARKVVAIPLRASTLIQS